MTAWLTRHVQSALFAAGRLVRSPLSTGFTVLVIAIALTLPTALGLAISGTLSSRATPAFRLTSFSNAPSRASRSAASSTPVSPTRSSRLPRNSRRPASARTTDSPSSNQ